MAETAAPPAVSVENAEAVNVSPQGDHLPYAWIIAAVTFLVLGGFGWVTWLVLEGEIGAGVDAATKGAVIQTWNNLALGAAAFWVGSSLAGKMTKKGVT